MSSIQIYNIDDLSPIFARFVRMERILHKDRGDLTVTNIPKEIHEVVIPCDEHNAAYIINVMCAI